MKKIVAFLLLAVVINGVVQSQDGTSRLSRHQMRVYDRALVFANTVKTDSLMLDKMGITCDVVLPGWNRMSRHKFRASMRAHKIYIAGLSYGLVIKKKEASLSNSASSPSINPSGTPESHAGYKVILANDYPLPINFIIRPINGGEKKSVMIAPSKKSNIYLIPGRYLVSFLKGGTQYGSDELLTIDGAAHIYNGEDCFGFAYMPRY